MKKIVSIVSALMVASMLFGQVIYAEDSSKNKFSEQEKKEIREHLSELNINQETQDNLIKKLENGEELDSMKKENLQKVANDMQNIGLNDSKTITFEDGSKIVYGTKLVNKNNGVQPMAAIRTVKSYWNTVVLNYSFYTDFVSPAGQNNDYIIKSYNPNVSLYVPGGSYDNEKVTVERKYETSRHRAYSRMDFKYSVPFGGSKSVDLFFNVGYNHYQTTLSKEDAK